MRTYEPFNKGEARRLVSVTCDLCGKELWTAPKQPWRKATVGFGQFDLCPKHEAEVMRYVEDRMTEEALAARRDEQERRRAALAELTRISEETEGGYT